MMYIDSYQWRVGSPVNPDIHPSKVSRVQADCSELAYIQEHFTNLPMVNNKKYVSWYGDHAKFIAANLPDQFDLKTE